MGRIVKTYTVKSFFKYRCDPGKRFCSSFKTENVRVRFAPSPTGYIHLGGLRTALYNHLFAKSRNGISILRIEDTDQKRKVEGAAEQIAHDLNWCGIHFDEGPYFQSDRKQLYEMHAKHLVDSGDAYYCFCSQTRLNVIKRESIKNGLMPKYDNKCRHLSKEQVADKLRHNEPCCIRFKVSSFLHVYQRKIIFCDSKLHDGETQFEDLIFGKYKSNIAAVEGDPIILKTDGFPTYHLANVVDDHCMNISHVLRGTEWLGSTIKHLLMYKAFKWKPPQYGHLPLLMNSDGTKFSKRQNDLQISYFKEAGYFPNTLINLVINAGGGFHIDQEERGLKSFSMDELIKRFDITKVHRYSCKLQLESIEEFNRMELKRMLTHERDSIVLVDEIEKCIKNHVENNEIAQDVQVNLDREYIRKVLNITQGRIHKVNDLVSQELSFLWFVPRVKFEEGNIKQEVISELIDGISEVNWNRSSLHAFLRKFALHRNVAFKELMINLRHILIGEKQGPGVAEIFELLGKESSICRLKTSIAK